MKIVLIQVVTPCSLYVGRTFCVHQQGTKVCLVIGEGNKVILIQYKRHFGNVRGQSETGNQRVGVISCRWRFGRSRCEQGSDICFRNVGTLYQTWGHIPGIVHCVF